MASGNDKKTKQHSPGKDYFDELEEAGKLKRYGSRDHRGSFEQMRTDESEGDLSEFSDAEVLTPKTVLKFVEHEPERKRERKKPVTSFVDPTTNLTDDDDDDDKPLSVRRKSLIRPLRISNSNHLKSSPGPGGRDSISPVSVKSTFSTRIRGKLTSMTNTIPGVFRRKRTADYKIQVFVAILFLLILLLVGSIYVIHQEKELQKAYFDRIRFSSKDRRIRVANLKGREVLTGVLGNGLTSRDKPWPCLKENHRENETCLEWMNLARLYFRVASPRKDWNSSAYNMQCYGIFWESLNPDFVPHDCFNIRENKGFYFYGGGEMGSNQWPLNRTSVPLSPFITGNKVNGTKDEFEWGRTMNRFFVGSPGIAIQISKETPLQVSINDDQTPGMLCFAAKRDSFAYPTHQAPNKLNYTLCTGDNVRDVMTQLADKDIWDGLKHDDVHMTHALSEAPIWRILPEVISAANGSEASLLDHTDHISAFLPSGGFILLDESWQKHIGDFAVDPDRFPTMRETFKIARRRGFKIALTIQPFFSTESANYVDGLKEDIWVKQRLVGSSKVHHIPALMHFKESLSVVLLDITKREARTWLQGKIREINLKYGPVALFVDLGSAQDLPQHYEFSKALSSPDEYKDIFLKTVRDVRTINTIGVTSAVKLPKLPTFVALSPVESSWTGLQSLVPNMLSLGVAGFPFIMPGPIGGDFKRIKLKAKNFEETAEFEPSSSTTANYSSSSSRVTTPSPTSTSTAANDLISGSIAKVSAFEANKKPDRELYIRWLQLAHFLPIVQYTYLPTDYDSKVIEIADYLKGIRHTKVYVAIKKAINDALITGLPIIRPLWMIDPQDPNCLKASDEFSIGGDIIVAPILHQNVTEREIYLPKGRWWDETALTSTKGERWLHHYRVRPDKIAFFTKMAEPAL